MTATETAVEADEDALPSLWNAAYDLLDAHARWKLAEEKLAKYLINAEEARALVAALSQQVRQCAERDSIAYGTAIVPLSDRSPVVLYGDAGTVSVLPVVSGH